MIYAQIVRTLVQETSSDLVSAKDDKVCEDCKHHGYQVCEDSKHPDIKQQGANVQTLKSKIHALQKSNWILRKEKEALRHQHVRVSIVGKLVEFDLLYGPHSDHT